MESNGAVRSPIPEGYLTPTQSAKQVKLCSEKMAAHNPLWLIRCVLGMTTMDYLTFVRHEFKDTMTANTLRGLEKGYEIMDGNHKGPTLRMVYNHILRLIKYAEDNQILDKLSGFTWSDILLGYVEWDMARQKQIEAIKKLVVELEGGGYCVPQDSSMIMDALERFADECPFSDDFCQATE